MKLKIFSVIILFIFIVTNGLYGQVIKSRIGINTLETAKDAISDSTQDAPRDSIRLQDNGVVGNFSFEQTDSSLAWNPVPSDITQIINLTGGAGEMYFWFDKDATPDSVYGILAEGFDPDSMFVDRKSRTYRGSGDTLLTELYISTSHTFTQYYSYDISGVLPLDFDHWIAGGTGADVCYKGNGTGDDTHLIVYRFSDRMRVADSIDVGNLGLTADVYTVAQKNFGLGALSWNAGNTFILQFTVEVDVNSPLQLSFVRLRYVKK